MISEQKPYQKEPAQGRDPEQEVGRDPADVKLIAAAAKALLRVSGVAENLFERETLH